MAISSLGRQAERVVPFMSVALRGGGFDGDHSLVLTPAESNVAMSLRIAAAALMMGHARRAPVPSPSRMSRSRRGLTFRALSMASWPRSPERWA